jgi:hypothetical protein
MVEQKWSSRNGRAEMVEQKTGGANRAKAFAKDLLQC